MKHDIGYLSLGRNIEYFCTVNLGFGFTKENPTQLGSGTGRNNALLTKRRARERSASVLDFSLNPVAKRFLLAASTGQVAYMYPYCAVAGP